MKNAATAILVILIIALSGAGFVYFKNRAAEKAADEAALREREAWEHKNKQLKQKVGSLEQDIDRLAQDLKLADGAPPLEQERRLEVFGDNGSIKEAAQPPATAHDRVMNFFFYLDRKGYLAARGVPGSSYEYCKSVMDRLLAASPVISGESRDMLTLLKNITFLFGVLGKRDTLLVRDILTSEAEIIEPTMKLFYQWLDPEIAMDAPERITVPFEKQYEYAAFFMQTIGGKAYLFRRDARTRQLASYYCLRIIDRANQQTLNTYGIDIRPMVSSLLAEIEGSKVLAGKQDYVEVLQGIKARSAVIRIERPPAEDAPPGQQP